MIRKIPFGTLLSTLGVGLLVATACGGTDSEDPFPSEKGSKKKEDEEKGKKKKPSPQEGDKQGSELACLSDKQCAERDQICDSNQLLCVDCVSDADCGDSASCVERSCVDATPCQSSKQCESSQVCDTYLERCVECVGDNDCSGGEYCVDSQCRVSCVSDKSCSALDQVCHSELSVCVECESDSDCSDQEYCSERSSCVPRVCGASAARCSKEGQALLSCNSSGSGFVSETCELGCVEIEGEARCRTEGGGGTTCVGWVSNVCSGIHELQGEQVVDGRGDEFCSIPARRIRLADGQNAAVKVAWSKEGLHLHVSVEDEAILVRSYGSLYEADNVQLFIFPSDSRGLFYKEVGILVTEGANQLAVSPPTTSVGDKGDSEVYYNERKEHSLMSYQAISRRTTLGYEVEVFWAWPGALLEAAGGVSPPGGQMANWPQRDDKILFNVQVGDLDLNDPEKRDYRMYLRPDAEGSSSCELPYLHCDVSRWCESPLL